MVSQIDPSVPIFGSPTTKSVRDNFLIAKNEITALQNQAGMTLPLPIASGGTGADDLLDAQLNLAILPTTGGVMTGPLTLQNTPPTGAFDAVPKIYVDNLFPVPIARGGTGAISATQALINLGAAPIASPAFTGSPTAPTAALGIANSQVATTAFVAAAIGAIPTTGVASITVTQGLQQNSTTGTVIISLDTPVAVSLGGTGATSNAAALSNLGALPLSGGIITGALTVTGTTSLATATGLTVNTADNSTALATTAWVKAQGFSNAPGTVTDVTAGIGLTGGQITSSGTISLGVPVPITLGGTGGTDAATALTNLGGAPIGSPSFVGIPTAPTPNAGTNTNQIATTAFVLATISGGGSFLPLSGGTITGNLGIQGGLSVNALTETNLFRAGTANVGGQSWATLNAGFGGLAYSGAIGVAWNWSNGNGEVDFFVNRSTGGAGGLAFYDFPNTSGAINPILQADGNRSFMQIGAANLFLNQGSFATNGPRLYGDNSNMAMYLPPGNGAYYFINNPGNTIFSMGSAGDATVYRDFYVGYSTPGVIHFDASFTGAPPVTNKLDLYSSVYGIGVSGGSLDLIGQQAVSCWVETNGAWNSLLEIQSVGVGVGSGANTGAVVAKSGTILSTGYGGSGQFRMAPDNTGNAYGSFWRNDGTATYLLLTNNNDALGTYNGLRPLTVTNSTGYIAFGEAAYFGGAVTVNGYYIWFAGATGGVLGVGGPLIYADDNTYIFKSGSAPTAANGWWFENYQGTNVAQVTNAGEFVSNGITCLAANSSYVYMLDASGRDSIYCGADSTGPQNIYRQNTHIFQTTNGTAGQMTIDSGGSVAIAGNCTVGGNFTAANVTSNNSVFIGGTQLYNNGGWVYTPNSYQAAGDIQANGTGNAITAPNGNIVAGQAIISSLDGSFARNVSVGNQMACNTCNINAIMLSNENNTWLYCPQGYHTAYAVEADASGTAVYTPNGNVVCLECHANNFVNTSDASLKADLGSLPDDCTSLLTAISPHRYRWLEGDNRTHWGFIAQDVEKAMTGNDFGGHVTMSTGEQAISYNEMVTVLWKACQEMAERLERTEQKLKEMIS